jgi:hypothetical protein
MQSKYSCFYYVVKNYFCKSEIIFAKTELLGIGLCHCCVLSFSDGGNQYERYRCGLPFVGIVFGLGQLYDVVGAS